MYNSDYNIAFGANTKLILLFLWLQQFLSIFNIVPSKFSVLTTAIEKNISALEKRLFEIVGIILFLAMGISFLEGFIVDSSVIIMAFNGTLSLIGALLFYLSRFKGIFEPLRYVMVVILNVFLVFYWYYLSGVVGPTAPGAIAVGTVSIIMARPGHRLGIFCLFGVLMAVLVFTQQFTDWVRLDVLQYETLFVDYLIFAISCLLIISNLKAKFDQERKVIHEKNEELERLNDKLKQTVMEKDQAINELKKTQDQLVESEKLATIGKLTAGIAHELNNPLNYVGGSVLPMRRNLDELKSLVTDEKLNSSFDLFEEMDLLMDNVGQGTEKAKSIIDKLGNLLPHKLDNGTSEEEEFRLSDILHTHIDAFRKDYPEVVFDFMMDQNYAVTIDPGDLKVILSNIVQNSIQAILPERKGVITIRTHGGPSNVTISISDNGEGIEKSKVAKVSDPFYTTKGDGGGKGLGMFVAFNLIQIHHGSIQIESSVGEGTTVSVLIPTIDSPNL